MNCIGPGVSATGSSGSGAAVIDHFPSRDECVIADLLERQAATRPDRVFAAFPDRTWTFAEAARQAWAMGDGLGRLGVEAGDPVSVWCPTGPELLQAWLGINAAGGVYAPLSLAARGSFLRHALDLAGSHVLIAHPALV
ncbi:MAG: AMP-binding protein, partial [Solirubrobacteraceae bacterium]